MTLNWGGTWQFLEAAIEVFVSDEVELKKITISLVILKHCAYGEESFCKVASSQAAQEWQLYPAETVL